jgi:hypothetical protein
MDHSQQLSLTRYFLVTDAGREAVKADADDTSVLIDNDRAYAA